MAKNIRLFTEFPRQAVVDANSAIDFMFAKGYEPKPIWWCDDHDGRITIGVNFRVPNNGLPTKKRVVISEIGVDDPQFKMGGGVEELIKIGGTYYIIAVM